MLTAEHISMCYGTQSVLHNVSLCVARGDFIGIQAPSGFGKSTLCRILAGYQPPLSGSVLWDNIPPSRVRGYAPVQLIWQHPEHAVSPYLTIRQILAEAGVHDDTLLHRLGIIPRWLSRRASELSGGQLQRVCIARALSEKTAYLLADEITAMLDPLAQAQLWQLVMDEAHRRRLGVVAVSHSQTLLEHICSRVIRLDQLHHTQQNDL